MDVAVRIETISIKLIGAYGVVRIIAPFPTKDSYELPKALYATTLANTLEPQVNENGAVNRVAIGIEQLVA